MRDYWLKQLGANPEAVRARYRHLSQPAVHLRRGATGGVSRLGGIPHMPADFAWPVWNGKPLAFLAQIDLAEIHAVLPSFLPATGRLFFFTCQDQDAWGYDPQHFGGWRVLYAPGDATTLSEHRAPASLPNTCRFFPKAVCPQLIDVLPEPEKLPPEEFDGERDFDSYHALRMLAFDGLKQHHQMFGHPFQVQGGDMDLECQLVSHGIYLGGPEGYQDPRVADLRAGASEWKLLLQLDSDDDCGWIWGDSGMLYFWVRESDARRGDFSKVWMMLECC